jgi:pimeloyl-ACP methyl ester carboxylesterase
LTILVHGGFHWGGCFTRVANALAERGRAVVTPDLASHGYDETPLSNIATMAEYVAPVERLVVSAERPVVLVGHSMGGLTLSYLGERYPEKIAAVIYLAALLPWRGLSLATLPSQESIIASLIAPLADGSGMRIKRDVAALTAGFYGDCTERDVSVAVANLSEVNPMAPFAWVSDVTPERFGRIPRTYIETLQDRTIPIATQRIFQAQMPGTSVRTLDTSHSPFFSCPREVADLIIAAPARPQQI